MLLTKQPGGFMKVQFVAKKIVQHYEGALLVDNKFQRACVDSSIEIMFDKFVEPIINASEADEVIITVELIKNAV
jgi:hypothetical protein